MPHNMGTINMLINLRALKACALFVSKDEARYYLKGVNLQFRRDHVLMCATNGHCLSLMRYALDETLDSELPDTIVPIELIDRIKLHKATDIAELYVDGRRISITYMGATYQDGAIDGSFPDYRRAIPSRVSGDTAQFDPAYIALFGKAKTLLSGIKQPLIGVSHNGLSPALISFVPEDKHLLGFGVLMPVRQQDCLTAPPAWASVFGTSVAQAA
jgi:DNA polymerase-3 subunit beta